MTLLRRAVFLERDGTLLASAPDADPRRLTLERGAGGALRSLKAEGFLLIVVSNQPGVALGRSSPDSLVAYERRIHDLLAANNTGIDAFYYCLHLPQAKNVRYAVRCLCRKPQPGLLRRAARDWQVDLGHSWLVGNVLDDVEAGNRAGCRTVLVDNGSETQWLLGAHRQPQELARSLRHAAFSILTAIGHRPRGGPEGEGDATDLATGQP